MTRLTRTLKKTLRKKHFSPPSFLPTYRVQKTGSKNKVLRNVWGQSSLKKNWTWTVTHFFRGSFLPNSHHPLFSIFTKSRSSYIDKLNSHIHKLPSHIDKLLSHT